MDPTQVPPVHSGHGHRPNRLAVPSTCERLGADATLTGRGVTMAWLDSGFVPHPDLTEPAPRILTIVEAETRAESVPDREPGAGPPPGWTWHGTQTAVVAAGSGFLSDGFYRGLASRADLVLVQVGERGRITDEAIVRGLEWVLANHRRFGIRVVNLSLGGDLDLSCHDSAVDRLAEALVAEGIVVVVAAGNAGRSSNPRPLPPANAPSVITVGGSDDGNRLDSDRHTLYWSSFGPTVDGLLKPEVVAPAIWVAAPLLPGSREWARAEALARLEETPDYRLQLALAEVADAAALSVAAWGGPADVRSAVDAALRDARLVATHYQHVDGTSFAAPIVASLAAQMLEANPALGPADVKQILVETADRLRDAPAVRQGYGCVNAARAVAAARAERHALACSGWHAPRVEDGRLVFVHHDDEAVSVALAGEMNAWDPAQAPFTRGDDGLWRCAVALPPCGRYRYKLVIDGARWIDDASHGLKEPDPYGGFNSVVHVAECERPPA